MHRLSDVDGRPFDVIVIGAGINGAGVARDAALRGLDVLLVEKGDVGGGTTSWSTRLVHGGLRYLESFEIPLVRESLRERETLLRIAPHLVKPLEMVIPIYEGDRRGPTLIRLGMVAYDALSPRKSLDHHHLLNRGEALEREPGLRPDGLRGAAVYQDAQVEYPERLAVENVLSARGAGATVLTHVRVERLVVEDNVCRGVELSDEHDGSRAIARGGVTVNVAGPWVDEVLAGAPRRSRRLIGGTKGSHLVVERFEGAPSEALYVEAAEDGRPYFIVPWRGLYLIGTTDLPHEGDLDEVIPSDDEIDYLISETNRVIPGAHLTRDRIAYWYAGVRPLPRVPDGEASAITRRHVIHDHAPDVAAQLVSIVGGKITTYRALAEQTVDLVFRKLGRRSPRCRTAELPLPGGPVSDGHRAGTPTPASAGIPATTGARLQRIYGARAGDVIAAAGDDPELLAPIGDEPDTLGAEVVFAVREELAQTLGDILVRRTMVGLNRSLGVGPDRAAADLCVGHLGWDDGWADREVERYRAYMDRYRPAARPGTGRPS